MSNSWDMPLDGVDVDNLGGFDRVLPGRYHAKINAQSFDAKNQMIIDYEICHGTLTTEIGKSFRDYFSPSPAARERALMLAVAAKVVTRDELQELQKQRRPFTRWKDLVGCHVKIELFEDEYQGKKKTKCGFGIFAIDDPKASNIPVNQGALEQSSDSNPFEDGVASDSGGGDDNPFGN